ncbi:MAG: hypothetical protein ABWY51_09085 [Gaiellaceae bacterium]
MRTLVGVLLLVLAGCGGGDSPAQLVDGSAPASLPAELDALDGALLTRTEVKKESDLDQDEYEACGVPADREDGAVVERTGLHGSSLTIESGRLLFGCDKIPDPATAEDPDLPLGGIWCASPNGRIHNGVLNDPRLDLCSSTDSEPTGFAWVEPQPATKWIVVSDAGTREVYEVAASLPVRVTTMDGARTGSSRASFDIAEYAADGRKLREYVLEAAVAG